jgi:Flp pilus assembly protein TadG
VRPLEHEGKRVSGMSKVAIRPCRNFWRDDSGVAALEFCLVAAPFFTILFGIMEIGLMFFSATLLEGGVGDASRLVRTGQIQAASDPVAMFRARLCESLIMVPCDQLIIEVREFSTFAAAGEDRPTYRSASDQNGQEGDLAARNMQFGEAGSVMISRVQYRYSFVTPVGMLVSGSPENSVLLLSTAVFKNEPYS